MIKHEISSQVLELGPGQASEVQLTLSNQSSIIDHFELSFEPVISPETAGMSPAWVSLTPPTFSLRPALVARAGKSTAESEQAVQVAITLPPQVVAGSYAGKIVLIARSGPDNNLTIPINVVVPEVEQQAFAMLPGEQTSRRSTGIFRVTLQNQGNAAHTYAVFAEDDANESSFSVTPSEVFLQPGQETALTLKVRPRRRNWASREQKHQFVAKLEGSSQKLDGTFIQKCALPPILWLRRKWIPILMVMGVIVALLIAASIFFLLPELNKVAREAICAPFSERSVRVVSNNIDTQIFISNRLSKDPAPVPVLSEKASSLPGLFASLVAVSADGRRLAYVTARNHALDDAKITVVDLESNQRFVIAVDRGLWPTAPVWSANGERLAYFKRSATRPANTATTAAATTAASTPGANPVATTTAAATAIPAGTAGSFRTETQLELWVMDKFGPTSKQMGKEEPELMKQLDSKLFYGEQSEDWPVVCWARDNSSFIVRGPKPLLNEKVESVALVDVPEGRAQKASLTPVADPLRRVIKKIPGVGFLPPPGRAEVLALAAAPAVGPVVTPRSKPSTSAQLQTACVLDRDHLFSQNDPRWSDLTLQGGSGARLADLGCPITGAAMMLNLHGMNTTPDQLMACLGPEASPLNPSGWQTIASRCSEGKVSGMSRTSFGWDGLNTALKKGPAIVGMVGTQLGQTFQHFVVVTSGFDSLADTYYVADPWDGTTSKTLGQFASWGYRPNLLISFEGGSTLECSGPRNAPSIGIGKAETNSNIDIEGVEDGKAYNNPQVLFNYSVPGGMSSTAETRIIRGGTNPGERLPDPINNAATTYRQEGVYNISIKTKPTAGEPINREVFFTIDRTGPEVITHTATPPIVPGKESDKPVSISLRAADSLSGVSRIEFQRIVNGVSGPPQIYTSDTTNNQLTFLANGSYRIVYWAIDGANNKSKEGLIDFNLKITAAVATPAAGAASSSGNLAPTPTPIPPLRTTAASGPLVAPTATLIPTSTPRPAPPAAQVPQPAVNAGGATNTTVAVTTPPATTAAVTTAPPTTGGTSLLPGNTTPIPTTAAATTVAATTAALTTVAVTTVAATTASTTLAVANAPLIEVSPSQLILPADNSPRTLTITNPGTATLNWTLESNTNGGLVLVSPSSGSTSPGGSTIVTIVARALNQTGTNQQAILSLNSNAGSPRNISIAIEAPALPRASFEPILNPSNLDITTNLKLTISTTNTISPSFAIITATYKTLESPLTPVDVPLIQGLRATDNWTFAWNTGNIVPQNTISVRGQLCVSPTLCTDIPEVKGLAIPMSATVLTPADGAILSPSTLISVTTVGRVTRVTLKGEYSGGESVSIVQPTQANGWLGNWDTSSVPPDVANAPLSVTLRGEVCNNVSGASEFCQPITRFVTGLKTVMTGTVSFQPALTSNQELPLKVDASVTGSGNVNHVALYASYVKSGGVVRQKEEVGRASAPWPKTISWDTSKIPAQDGVELEVQLCYDQGALRCSVLSGSSIINLKVPVGAPEKVEEESIGDVLRQANTNEVFNPDVSVRVFDIRGSLVPNTPVVFQIVPNATSGAGGSFAGLSSVTVTTTQNGIATAPPLKANNFAGGFSLTASAGNRSTSIVLNNKRPGAPELLAVNGSSQQARLGEKFPLKFRVKAAGAVIVTFRATQSQGIASGVFSNGSTIYSVVTNATTFEAESLDFYANNQRGPHSVAVEADGYNSTGYNVTNLAGKPVKINITGGNNQSAKILKPFNPMQVQVEDASGNTTEMGGHTITFTALGNTANALTTGGNPGGTALTLNNGTANSPVFTANNKVGSYVVEAKFEAATANFNFTNVAGDPDKVENETPKNLDCQVDTSTCFLAGTNTPVNPLALRATVKDVAGNPVSGSLLNPNAMVFTVITTTATGPTGLFNGNSSTTVAVDNVGVGTTTDTFKANCKLGSYTVEASVAAAPVKGVFNVKNIIGAPGAATVNIASASVTVNQNLGTTVTATIKDSCANAVDGQPVTFRAPVDAPLNSTPSGVFTTNNTNSIVVTTSVSGVYTMPAFKANQKAGAAYLIEVLINGTVLGSFTVVNTPGAAVAPLLAPNNSSTAINAAFPAVVVTVQDQFGNPRPGDTVAVTLNPVGGATATFTLNPAGGVTGADGKVTANFTANDKTGLYSATITANSLSSTLSLRNNSGPPAALNITPVEATDVNMGIQAKITETFAAVTIEVRDAGGNTVANAPVTITVNPVGGATATFTLSNGGLTNAAGVVTANFTAGTIVGDYDADISAGGNANATIYLSNLVGAALAPIITPASATSAATPITAVVGANSSDVTIKIQDAGGNPISGVGVTVAIVPVGPIDGTVRLNGSGGFNTSVTRNTNAAGQVTATFKGGTKTGDYTATVTSGGQSVTVFIRNVAGAPTDILITPTSSLTTPQATAVGTNFNGGAAFTFEVRDTYSNTIPNYSVTVVANTVAGAGLNAAPTSPNTTGSLGVLKANNTVGDHNVVLTAATVIRTIYLRNTAGAAVPPVVTPVTTVATPLNGTVGSTFSTVATIKIQDAVGNAIINTPVTVTIVPVGQITGTVTLNGATSSGPATTVTVNTNGSGQLSATFTGGTKAGDYTATVQSGGQSSTIFLRNDAGPAADILLIPATSTTATPGRKTTPISSDFTGTFSFEVRDTYSNTLPNVSVNIAVSTDSSGATLSNPPSSPRSTGASGVANLPTLTANNKVGDYDIKFSVNGIDRFIYLRNANGPALAPLVEPTTITSSTTPHTAKVDNTFNEVKFTIEDAGANRLVGTPVTVTINPVGSTSATVTLTGATSSGPGTTVTVNTNGSGQVSASFKAGTVSGDYSATITAQGQSTTIFLRNTPGDATSISISPATSNTAAPGRQSTITNTNFVVFTISVRDSFNNIIPNSSVTVTPNSESGGAALNPSPGSPINTGTTGVVDLPTLTANANAGDHYLNLSSAGANGVIYLRNT